MSLGGEDHVIKCIKRRNSSRISGAGLLERKAMGTRVDIRFSDQQYEYGCAEASPEHHQAGTKTINEGRLKLPGAMKDILLQLAKSASSSISGIKVCRFLISGKSMITKYTMEINIYTIRLSTDSIYHGLPCWEAVISPQWGAR